MSDRCVTAPGKKVVVIQSLFDVGSLMNSHHVFHSVKVEVNMKSGIHVWLRGPGYPGYSTT